MDSGRGFMVELPQDIHRIVTEKWPTSSGVFQVGEELEIKKAWFKVKKINNFGIMLKSIPSKSKEILNEK